MKSSILLRNLLLSTSSINMIKYEKDKKKRKKLIGQNIGLCVLYLFVMFMFVVSTVGYCLSDMAYHVPALCVVNITVLTFLFTVLKTNGYLFAFKDYDILMSLPFSVKQVVSCKFLYMYVRNLIWAIIIMIPMEIGYGIFCKPSFIVYIIWTILAVIAPLIPMVIASFIGVLVAGISSRFKHKNMLQTIFTFIIVLFCFFSRFVLESVFKDSESTRETMQSIFYFTEVIKHVYIPVVWFEKAIVKLNVLSMILFVGVSIVVYEVSFIIISRYYKSINSRLMANSAHVEIDFDKIKEKSVAQSIAYKEFKHFLHSTPYVVNMGLGMILIMIFSIVLPFVGMDSVLRALTHESPLTAQMMIPAVPMIVFFLLGMTSSTSVSPSLEGKQIWLIDSLPISKRQYYNGKMLFNLYIMLPFAIIGNIICALSCGASALAVALCVFCGIIQSFYNTTWGMVLGLKHIKTEWNTEMEVIKQGSACVLYMLPNMFVTMILCVGAVILGLYMRHEYVILILCALYSVPALLSYVWIKNRERK